VERGRLRIYVGYAPGVGKTYAMLDEARRRRARGTDVVLAVVDAHGRQEVAVQTRGLEVAPRRRDADGTPTEEMDVDAVLARRPEVAVVDELAHTNAAGSRNADRWQDVEELLAAGIDVISTVNIHHLESLHDVIEGITGEAPADTVPDVLVRDADQLELVDMTPQALQRRLQRLLQLFGADAPVADRGDHGVRRVPLVVIRSGVDPPHAERDYEEAEQDLDDNRSRSGADRLQHGRLGVIVEGDV